MDSEAPLAQQAMPPLLEFSSKHLLAKQQVSDYPFTQGVIFRPFQNLNAFKETALERCPRCKAFAQKGEPCEICGVVQEEPSFLCQTVKEDQVFEENLCFILDLTKNCDESSLYLAYQEIANMLVSVPESVTISVLFFGSHVHYLAQNGEQVEIVTLADDMMELIDEIPDDLCLTNRAAVIGFFRRTEKILKGFGSDETGFSVMSSCFYLFSHFVDRFEIRSRVIVISASSTTHGYCVPVTIEKEDAPPVLSSDFTTYFLSTEVKEQIQVNVAFIGQHADFVPYSQLANHTGGKAQIASLVVHDMSHINVVLNLVEYVVQELSQAVYNVQLDVFSSHRMNYQVLHPTMTPESQVIPIAQFDQEFPIALDIAGTENAVQLALSYSTLEERKQLIATFPVPLTLRLDQMNINPDITFVLLSKLIALQKDLLSYKYFVAQSTSTYLKQLTQTQIQQNLTVILQYMHRFYVSSMFSNTVIMRCLIQNYFATASPRQIISSINQQFYLCNNRRHCLVRQLKPELLSHPQTAVVIQSFTQTRIFICINDIEPTLHDTIECQSESSHSARTPKSVRKLVGQELGLQQNIRKCVSYMQAGSYDITTTFFSSQHRETIDDLLVDTDMDYEDWLSKIWQLE